MFTGVIEEIGVVEGVVGDKLTVTATKVLEDTRLGNSINVNGACLTVVHLSPVSFTVEVMAETRRRTNLGDLRHGDRVNLERALAVGARLGGHYVQGHVEATGEILSFTPEGDGSVLVRFVAPPQIMRYVVEKGFIAVDGISLTVAERNVTTFSVSLVGYTQAHTSLAEKRAGDKVNLETDVIAKYVGGLRPEVGGGITLEFLAEHGYLVSR
ncbi:MAG: riboflavin synthase [Chloroflexi bacterium]|nr:riboflavin synthase [Chloroflexota bacterium]